VVVVGFVSSAEVLRGAGGRRGDKEVVWEEKMGWLLREYGFCPPAGVSAGRGLLRIEERTVFVAIRRCIESREGAWLRGLGCGVGALERGLEAETGVGLWLLDRLLVGCGLCEGGETERAYMLLTAYLMFTSLVPDDVVGLLSRAMTSADVEDMRAVVVEYFSFLGLWLELWNTQSEGLMVPRGAATVNNVMGEQSRRVLVGRLREWVRRFFAPAKPLLPRERVAVPASSAPAGRKGTMLVGRRLGSYNGGPVAGESSTRARTFGRSMSSGDADEFPSSMPIHETLPPLVSTLTEEQMNIVDTDLGPGELMKVRAYAGTGKTRSLVEYAKKRPRMHFLYVAFNKSAEIDAKEKFGINVECMLPLLSLIRLALFKILVLIFERFIGKTVHALALRALIYVSPAAAEAKNQNTMQILNWWGSKDIVKFLGLDSVGTVRAALENPAGHEEPKKRRSNSRGGSGGKKPWPTAHSVSVAVKWGLDTFWNSVDRKVLEKHLPHRIINTLGLKKDVVLKWVQFVWQSIHDGKAPWLPHDAYLKLFHLYGEVGEGDEMAFGSYDIIMFDEAQDANPCMAEIVMRQIDTSNASRLHSPGLIVVGDPYQRIYGFRGAGNEAFDDKVFPAVKTAYLTWSFRFGDGIASVANTLLRALDESVPLNGVRHEDKVSVDFQSADPTLFTETPGPQSSYPFTVIFRKNVTLIRHAIAFAIRHSDRRLHLRIQREFQTKALFSALRDAHALYHHSKPLRGWKTWAELAFHVESAPTDSPLLTLIVQLEPELKQRDFVNRLVVVEANILPDEFRHLADVVLVTAHQAKGLEWDRVHIAGDFLPGFRKRGELRNGIWSREEMNVLYVAVTRARKELVLSPPVAEWIVAERGRERVLLSMLSPTESEGCGLCVRRSAEEETEAERACRRVLIETEGVLKAGSFTERAPALPGWSRGPGRHTVCCLRCAKVELGLATAERVVGPGNLRANVQELVKRLTTPEGRVVRAGVEEIWAARCRWEESWGRWREAENSRVMRWTRGEWGVWRTQFGR
jgi:hypothetical protein